MWAFVALASELCSPPQAVCVWDVVVLSPCACSPVRGTGTTHVVRPCFQGLLVDVCTLSLVSCFVTPPCRRCTLADQANLLAAVSRRLRLLTPAAVAAFADQAPRGQRVPLDQFRLLLIDRSAESVESFLPNRSRVWRRLASTSRQLTLLTHLEAPLVVTHCEPVSNFTLRFVSLRRYSLSTHLDLHVEAIMPCWHSRRRLALPTHLELRLEGCCRGSFFADSSRRV